MKCSIIVPSNKWANKNRYDICQIISLLLNKPVVFLKHELMEIDNVEKKEPPQKITFLVRGGNETDKQTIATYSGLEVLPVDWQIILITAKPTHMMTPPFREFIEKIKEKINLWVFPIAQTNLQCDEPSYLGYFGGLTELNLLSQNGFVAEMV